VNAWRLLSGCGLALGCSQILDLQPAHLDPASGATDSGGAAAGVGPTSLPGGAAGSHGSAQGGEAAGAGATGLLDAGAPAAPDGGEGGAGSAPEPPSLCQSYCAAVSAACVGPHTQYIDLDACLASCAALPEGAPGDTAGNSVHCRATYAEKAPSEPYTYCTWAGPGGDGKCGTNCDGFCTLMMQACTASTTLSSKDYYESLEACHASCDRLPDVGSYDASDSLQQMGSDHVQCRLYHVGAALAEADPITHCPHATGQRLCVNAPK
jgi:hypothetical protein